MTVYANRSNETVLSAAMQIIILLCLQNSMGVQDEKVLCFDVVYALGSMNEYVPVLLIKRGKFIKRRQGIFTENASSF